MSFYFCLQFRLLNRHIKDFGLPPLWGWLLGITGFFLFSWLLFVKISFALYLYLLLAASWLLQLSNRKRSNFLKIIFPDRSLHSVRMAENTIVAMPFILFLLYRQYFLAAILLLPASLALSFFHHSSGINASLPTPFGKKPFEFVTGFRQSLLFTAGAYLLTGIGIFVSNFNLCLFAYGVIFLLIFSFYTKPEPLFYLWNFAFTPAGFLKEKIKAAMLHTTILTIIPLVTLLIIYPEKWWMIAGIQLLGYLYIVQIVLIKYIAYPGEITLIQALIFSASIFFPPLLLGLIPFYYSRSVNRLATYLT